MKIAAIDLGSNTFHLLIAEYKNNQVDIIFKTHRPVKLSENITLNNCIIPKAFERGITCLQEFKSIVNKYGVDQTKAVATSAIRSAKNGEDFVKKAQELTSIKIEIISGDKEADLIYSAVKASGAIKEKSLIMDIGGGSTEFIFCDEDKSYWRKSYDIGAARLMQNFFKSDPISVENMDTINSHLRATLSDLLEFNKEFKAINLIGSAGAFETYLEMIQPETDLQLISTSSIDIFKYKDLSSNLKSSTHRERLVMPNLIPLRVDMIVMAFVLTDFIINNLNIQQINMSTYDLKYGIVNQSYNFATK
ncbi:Ppx/GppA phosphatase family protein [Sphingobacterium bovistauri]|uniref:Exopolyphosphatase n=1 Tax=Sphingobacterium bovistauri TaxID=2781959 RepID=A0ABS7Z754_9SPHI|nr:exopolyphosphatase [Sphingobacterium bovistauri]MCA5006015.1 exopolyphosphatase [Sphingobacterium bovistauri]